MENHILDGTNRLKLQTTSYSDHGYDLTNSFRCLEKFLTYTFPAIFHFCQTPNSRGSQDPE